MQADRDMRGATPRAAKTEHTAEAPRRRRRRGRFLFLLLLMGLVVGAPLYLVRSEAVPAINAQLDRLGVTPHLAEWGLLTKEQAAAAEEPQPDFVQEASDWVAGVLPELPSIDELRAEAGFGSSGDDAQGTGLEGSTQVDPDTLVAAPTLDEQMALVAGTIDGDIRPRLEAMASEVASLRGDFSSLQKAVDTARDSLAAKIDAVKAEHGGALEDLEARVASFGDGFTGPSGAAQEKLAAYEEMLAQLATDVVPEIEKPKPQVIATPVEALPFEVHSIDLWGNSPQLTVSRDSESTFMGIGDAYRGWTVTDIDRGSRAFAMAGPGDQTGIYRFSGSTLVAVAQELEAEPSPRLDGRPTLTVDVFPGDARVRVMNIKPIYHDEMALEPGPYEIWVDVPGFEPYRRWHRLGQKDRVIPVKLEVAQ